MPAKSWVSPAIAAQHRYHPARVLERCRQLQFVDPAQIILTHRG
jgi:hypothetical protein